MPPRRTNSIERFDRQTGISQKAKKLASERGHDTTYFIDNFGRNLEYYRTIHETLKHFCKKLKGKRILHIGASSGIYTRFLQAKGVKAIAMDISQDAVDIAKRIGNKRVHRGDVLQPFRFPTRSLDAVVSDNLLFSFYSRIGDDEYIASHVGSFNILSELHRILKEKGIVLIYGHATKHTQNFEETVNKKGFNMTEHDGVLVLVKKAAQH